MKSRSKFGFLPVFLVLLIALVILLPVSANWRSLSRVFGEIPHDLSLKASWARSSRPNLKADVWVDGRSGLYYCSESKYFGKMKPGFRAVQEEALQNGYRPVLEKPCP